MQTISQMSEAASNTKDSRMQGLALANAGFAGKNAYDAIQVGQLPKPTGGNNPSANTDVEPSAADKAGGINLAISIGSSSSQSNSLSQSNTSRGSAVTAGGTITIAATGGVNTNCVSCVNAAQQRLTGQNLNAVASPSTGYANHNALLPSAPFGFGNPTSPMSVIAEMQQAGNGAARPLIVQQNGVDHVINVVNRNGQVYFIDTQLGQIVTLQPNVIVKLGRPI